MNTNYTVYEVVLPSIKQKLYWEDCSILVELVQLCEFQINRYQVRFGRSFIIHEEWIAVTKKLMNVSSTRMDV